MGVMKKNGPEAKLLVVDDEPNIRELLSTSLRFAGFEVVAASNGREALADASLEEVAADQNVSYDDVVSAALAAAKTDLDAAVVDGAITQDRADAIYDHLSTWLADGGAFEGPGHGWGRGHRHGGPGLGFFGG